MKSLPLVLTLFIICTLPLSAAQKRRPCDPLTGDAIPARVKTLNTFKNRSRGPTSFEIDPTITIERILAPGNDSRPRFPMTKAATITGYVASVKVGGIETCNCHATDPAKMDAHIDLVSDPKYAAPKYVKITTTKKGKRTTIKKDVNQKYHMIVEVTPRVRKQQATRGIDWNTDTLKRRLTHHWVRFSGWLFFDSEHLDEAENTNPGNKRNWRATCTEIHPVFAINVVR